ncbi:MAG: hypothetical protein QG633_448 [Patescibacteria group bacterium]|jgi:DMSO/TMAO reductase YedYZ heme-binding membrane subunit|nr:hypothetical protein [Patescibacteria group bacterium]
MSKQFFKIIALTQKSLLGISIALLAFGPVALLIWGYLLPMSVIGIFYTISLVSVTFVMSIRPLADIANDVPQIRALVILRKGFGVLSASIIVTFLLAKLIEPESVYLASIFTSAYWSLDTFSLFAHLGDITGVILLITSNTFSKRILGPWWKRVQKLAYVYFYAGALYEMLALQSTFAMVAMGMVTVLVLIAWVKKRFEKVIAPATTNVAA